MQILQWRDILENNNRLYFETPGTGISVGSFDGLHLGHLALFEEALKLKEEKGNKFNVIYEVNVF